ncbi:MAG: hypothetical protein U0790_02445 [Isosphaeraceae bacterium]
MFSAYQFMVEDDIGALVATDDRERLVQQPNAILGRNGPPDVEPEGPFRAACAKE